MQEQESSHRLIKKEWKSRQKNRTSEKKRVEIAPKKRHKKEDKKVQGIETEQILNYLVF